MKKIKSLAIWGLILIVCLFFAGMLGIASVEPEAAITFVWTPFVFGFVATGLDRMKLFDWSRIKEYGSIAEVKEDIIKRFNEFTREIADSPLKVRSLFSGEKFTGPDPALSGTTPVVLVMADRRTPDRGYEKIFDPINMRQSASRAFDVLDVSGGITYYQTVDGEEAKLSKVPAGAKTSCSMLRFTGGFAILDDWLKFNEYYKMDQMSAQSVRDWWKNKAIIMYGLITALTGIDQAFSTNDETTINNACANIMNDLNALGYDVGDGSEFVIVCNPMLRSRLRKALATTYEIPITGSTAKQGADKVDYTISALITTPKIVTTSYYYVCLPGEKVLQGDWEDLNARPAQRNELKLGADYVWTGAYNGIIAEKKQFKKCALS